MTLGSVVTAYSVSGVSRCFWSLAILIGGLHWITPWKAVVTNARSPGRIDIFSNEKVLSAVIGASRLTTSTGLPVFGSLWATCSVIGIPGGTGTPAVPLVTPPVTLIVTGTLALVGVAF